MYQYMRVYIYAGTYIFRRYIYIHIKAYINMYMLIAYNILVVFISDQRIMRLKQINHRKCLAEDYTIRHILNMFISL